MKSKIDQQKMRELLSLEAEELLSSELSQIKGGTAPPEDCGSCKAGCATCQPGNS